MKDYNPSGWIWLLENYILIKVPKISPGGNLFFFKGFYSEEILKTKKNVHHQGPENLGLILISEKINETCPT